MNPVTKIIFGHVLLICAPFMTVNAQNASITVHSQHIENKLSKLIYGSNIEDVNHEIYGGFYDQRIFGESFEEPATGVDFSVWQRYTGHWKGADGVVSITPGFNTVSDVYMRGVHSLGTESDFSAKLIYDAEEYDNGAVEAEVRFNGKGERGGLIVRVAHPGIGSDVFDGYEVSLGRDGKSVVLGKHVQNFELLKTAAVAFDSTAWNRLRVRFNGPDITVDLNNREVLSYRDDRNPLLKGKIGLRTWKSAMEFRNVKVDRNGKSTLLRMVTGDNEQVSYNWDMVRSPGVKAAFKIDSSGAFNGRNAQAISFEGGTGRAGIANRGLNRWGIAVRKGQVFEGRLYLKADRFSGPVVVALESADGRKTYATRVLNGISGSWKKYPFELASNASDPNARLTVSIASKGRLWVDQVVLTGTGEDRFAGLPVRADIGKMIVRQGVTFLRYAGTMVNAPEYRFKNMIGDPDKRPPYRGHWNRYSTNGFGIEEFLQYCEAASITPCFAINIYETPEDMADMVEYLNGGIGTKWGARRAKNGHAKPYGVKYIEIGNEEVLFNGDSKEGYEEYVQRFHLLSEAMKQKDNSLSLIHSAWWRPSSPHMPYVFKELNGKADYWDLHVGGDNPDEGLETDKKLHEMLGMFRKWDPATKMKIAVFEENGSKHAMQRALGHATNLNAIRRHNEDVLTSSPANALQPYLQNDNDWDQGQIFFTPDQVWGMPPFYAQRMQAENHMPLRVRSEAEGGLDVTATRSEDGQTLVLHVVNTGPDAKKTNIALHGFGGNVGRAEAFTLSGELTGHNTPARPERYSTVKHKISLDAQAPSYDFAPHSYTILRFEK